MPDPSRPPLVTEADRGIGTAGAKCLDRLDDVADATAHATGRAPHLAGGTRC
ncbi:hypothetical protein QZN11_00475 [Streptomyces gramineus]|uniref:hypothetical protein n=1 Tax=Streptomyces gramineus TaxID=910542 RepID=UPI00398BB75E